MKRTTLIVASWKESRYRGSTQIMAIFGASYSALSVKRKRKRKCSWFFKTSIETLLLFVLIFYEQFKIIFQQFCTGANKINNSQKRRSWIMRAWSRQLLVGVRSLKESIIFKEWTFINWLFHRLRPFPNVTQCSTVALPIQHRISSKLWFLCLKNWKLTC